jgi:hypothetical protein
MRFEQFTPPFCHPVSARANAPATSGIDGSSNAREWILIGESDNLQSALLPNRHLSDSGLLKGFLLPMEDEPVCNRPLLVANLDGTI